VLLLMKAWRPVHFAINIREPPQQLLKKSSVGAPDDILRVDFGSFPLTRRECGDHGCHPHHLSPVWSGWPGGLRSS
jgi:hypothetical protein